MEQIPINQHQFNIAVENLIDDVDREYETDYKGTKLKPNVKTVVHGVRSNLTNKYSQVIILSSMYVNGMGKSSLGYDITKQIDKKFELERNFFFRGGTKDIEAQTDKIGSGGALCLDEMVRLWYSRQAMTKKVIDLNMWMAADQRKTEVGLIGAIPSFWMLDSYARIGKVDMYIEILARGIGVKFKADHFPKTDPWHSDTFDMIVKKRKKGLKENIVDKVKLLQRHPCYDGLVFWNKMPKDDEKIYLDLVKKAKDAQSEESDEEKFKKVYKEKYDKPRFKAYSALQKFVNLFKVKGATKSRALKEAGLEPNDYDKMMKDLSQYNKVMKEAKV